MLPLKTNVNKSFDFKIYNIHYIMVCLYYIEGGNFHWDGCFQRERCRERNPRSLGNPGGDVNFLKSEMPKKNLATREHVILLLL